MGNSTSAAVPATMRRLVLSKPHDDPAKAELSVEEVAMPVPRSGQVLVKVIAAPVNPSDYGGWKPTAPGVVFEKKAIGNEGSGVVISSGGGTYANSVVGKHVGFINNVKNQGSYGEYILVNAMEGIFPLPDHVPVADAASHFVNPYTAFGFIDTVRARHAASGNGSGKPGFVHTAAASQLGQMLVKLCKTENVNIINIVRKQEQEDILKALNAEHIIRSDIEGWEAKLEALMKELNVRIAFDAIAGDMSGKLLTMLPIGGSLYVYGVLSGAPVAGIAPIDLIYRKKKVEGWYLGSWIKGEDSSTPTVTMLMRMRNATACVHEGLVAPDGWAASQFVDTTLDEMQSKFVDMMKDTGFTGKKLRIRFPDVAPSVVVGTAVAAPPAATADTTDAKEESPSKRAKTEEDGDASK